MSSTRTEEEKEIQQARQEAVRLAWEREADLVRQGKGTRDWTKEEQHELLVNGSISGYHGHHMSSVKTDLENARNPENIQFLTPEEHLAAHDGDYKHNPTNGYYDVKTGKTNTFENGKIEAAPIQDLSEKLVDPENLSIPEDVKQNSIDTYNQKMDEKLQARIEKINSRTDLTEKQKEENIAWREKTCQDNKEKYLKNLDKYERKLNGKEEKGKEKDAEEKTSKEEGKDKNANLNEKVMENLSKEAQENAKEDTKEDTKGDTKEDSKEDTQEDTQENAKEDTQQDTKEDSSENSSQNEGGGNSQGSGQEDGMEL